MDGLIVNLLFVGDAVGKNGTDFLFYKLRKLKERYGADVIVVNGENSHERNGIDTESARAIFDAGADVITTGNHCFRQKGFEYLFTNTPSLLRPANFPRGNPGTGYCVIDAGGVTIAVINLLGTMYTGGYDNPFFTAEKILGKLKTPNIFVDFHAEATAEKKTMGYCLRGRVTAVLGTHTHVQTADEQILSGHTAYITDVGMCGAEDSILGMDTENSVRKIKFLTPVSYEESKNPAFLNAVLINFDETNGKALSVTRIIER
ncbi:MAG: TIGR00282 family metallophosphoesterase [Ruminococcus sp.]|jgi:metallophosphoesterase (TIGR00282 family)|nr:TIGR00282 family metallophosphoesterase [Ruminococcus sp.]